jgi:hypothetical protein
MAQLTYAEVVAALGPIDDLLIGEILAVGASSEEFARARAWLANDEAPINAGESLASGRVARLINLLESLEAELTPDGPEPGQPGAAQFTP